MKITEIQDIIIESITNDDIDNENIVQITELCGNFLNLQTISNYAKKNNISYNGAKNNRKVISLFDVKFIIDNK